MSEPSAPPPQPPAAPGYGQPAQGQPRPASVDAASRALTEAEALVQRTLGGADKDVAVVRERELDEDARPRRLEGKPMASGSCPPLCAALASMQRSAQH